MWQALLFLFLGFVIMFGMASILQPNNFPTPSSSFRSMVHKKREKMNFPSNHLSTSLITPDNSPCSSRTTTQPSTPSIPSYRNSPIPYSTVNSPILLSRTTSRRSLFSHELSDTTSDLFHHGG